jgi:hypothetical protein
MGDITCAYRILVGKLEGKRANERSGSRRKDNPINIDYRETGY